MFCFILYIRVGHALAVMHLWRSEANLQKSVLSLCGPKHLYPSHHHIGSYFFFFLIKEIEYFFPPHFKVLQC